MLLGCIADDFTGAGDLANTLAREGMRTRMVIGSEAVEVVKDDEAVVVALKTRSAPAAEAVAQSLAALRRLRKAGARQFFFKYCSTFDSTPEGNIGPVADALAEELQATGVVVCPAFPATGRTVYQGHLFVGDRLLSESGMERHPLTPMTDPDIRRWLGRQIGRAPGHLPLSVVRGNAGAIGRALRTATERLVVADAVDERDLRSLGGSLGFAKLVTGGSGVAMGLPENFRRAGLLSGTAAALRLGGGPAVVLSGSCSSATLDQVRRHARTSPSMSVPIEGLLTDPEPILQGAVRFVREHPGKSPLVHSSDAPEAVSAIQARHGKDRAAAAVERFFGTLARECIAAGCRRLVIAGGETSGAVVSALGITSLSVGPEIAAGVPALSASLQAGGVLGLVLKSGNFGDGDFFARAISALGGADA